MEKADKWFKGEESYSDVCDMMDKEYFNSFVSTHKSNVDITAVDQLFDAGYDLQEATEYLQATNLTSKQIKERWDELSTPSEEPLIKTRTEKAVATVNLDAKPYDYGASGMAQ
jgi:S-adenosylmethionine synthetase